MSLTSRQDLLTPESLGDLVAILLVGKGTTESLNL